MTEIRIAEYTFRHICKITPELGKDRKPIEQMPQSEYDNVRNLPLNNYGKGPFCKFRIPSGINDSGVYALSVDDSIKYIGQCDNLSKRWNMGYGNISPKNCFVGGQSTNCRVNNLILDAFNANYLIKLFFHKTDELDVVEDDLINYLNPEWNIKAPGKYPRKYVAHSTSRKAVSAGNKYQLLTDYLSESSKEVESLSYAKLKEILGFELPYSAYEYREWWANSGHKHAQTWTTAGWKVIAVNLGKEVRFEKEQLDCK